MNRKVLIIDDDPDIRDAMQVVLEREGSRFSPPGTANSVTRWHIPRSRT